jgi:hypothetical protein
LNSSPRSHPAAAIRSSIRSITFVPGLPLLL